MKVSSHRSDIPEVTPALLRGCWRRNWIQVAGGERDGGTRVWWVQGDVFYGDIRIPAGRPSFEGVDCLEKCSLAQRRWLATQQGFAGKLGRVGEAFCWERELDFQPPSDARDVGYLRFVDQECRIISEEGAEQPYFEEWERIGGRGEPVVLRMESGGGRGLLVAAGEHFLMAVDRRGKLPRAGSLLGLLEGCGEREQVGLLDMEISHGVRVGALEEWVVSESTLPWRERRGVFETFSVEQWKLHARV